MASSLSNTASATVSADEKTSAIASAPLANPIAAHPPALALAPPVQLGEPLRGSDPASTDATDLAASTSSKPVRPPRAVQRPSTASRRTSASGAESIAGTNPAAAFTSGNGVSSDANASEGTTLVGAGTAESSVPEMSSVEKVDDAAAKAAIQESAGTPVPTANSSTVTASSADKRPSTVSQTVVADDSATSTPKSGAAAQPASSSSANNNIDTTTPPRTSSPPAATGTAGTSRPRTAQPTTSSASAKKRKGGFSLLACLPCFGSTGHEEDPPQQSNAPARRASPAPRATETEKQQEKVPQAASSDVPVVPAAEPAVAANESPVVVENEKAVPAEGTDSPVAVTSPIVEPTSAVVASTDDAVSQPGPTAPAAHNGVVLSADETEGVTSGAVVPPGRVAASQVPHPPTPTPRQRRRRAKQQQQARSGTEGIITSVPEPGAVGGGILLAPRHDETTSSEISTDEEDDEDDIDESEEEEEEEDEEQMLIARGGVGIPIGEDGLPHPLLDELSSDLHGRKCLVLDLDETLVHSSFKMVHQADFVVPVEIENQFHNVYVIKRPGVDAFLKAMGEIYEVVVFTASLSKYADPVLDHLDIHRVVKHRLFRESCYNNKGNYVKDLSQLGRPISECIIIDNSPASYVFHPNNAVPISSWFNDPHDTELTDLIPFLADLSSVEDIRSVLDANLYLPSMIAEGTAVVGTGETDGISPALQQL